jgi:hypothetical protein
MNIKTMLYIKVVFFYINFSGSSFQFSEGKTWPCPENIFGGLQFLIGKYTAQCLKNVAACLLNTIKAFN